MVKMSLYAALVSPAINAYPFKFSTPNSSGGGGSHYDRAPEFNEGSEGTMLKKQ